MTHASNGFSPRRAKGLTTLAGYGAAHQKLRARWALVVARGGVLCARCQRPIPADPRSERCPAILAGGRVCGKLNCGWHLGHHDRDRSVYTGPEHACCNGGAPRRNRTRRRVPELQPWRASWF